MKKATIKTKFGEICISFDTKDQLEEELKGLEEQIEIIQKVTDKVAPPPIRTAKPGYESYYRFLPNGDLELIYTPEYKHEVVALVMFAYHPEPLSLKDIERLTRINRVASTVITIKQYKKYFKKVDDKYTLSYEGIKMVGEKIGGVVEQETERESLEEEKEL